MRTSAALIYFGLLSGCDIGAATSQAGTTPTGLIQTLWCKVGTCRVVSNLDFTLPSVIYSSVDEVPVTPAITNPNGERLVDVPVQFQVEPASVAVVTQKQGIRCVNTGTAVLSGTAESARHAVPFSCRLVDRISVTDHFRLLLGDGPVSPVVEVYDTAGQLIAGGPTSITIADRQVLRESEGKLIPEQIGISRVTFRAGDKRAHSLVTVVQRIKHEPLLLNDGARVSYALTKGNYEVAISVKSGASTYGVTLDWIGGDGCEDHSESQEFTSRCRITSAGSLVIENPTTFGLGPAANGYITISEVP